MQTTDTAALLQAAPEEHSRRCALAKSALDSQRWPAAACGLRHAAAQAQDWATRAREMADWCDAQAEPGRLHSVVGATLTDPSRDPVLLAPDGPITLEALEAGLMALAHHLGRDHAVHVRRAINGVVLARAERAGRPACSPCSARPGPAGRRAARQRIPRTRRRSLTMSWLRLYGLYRRAGNGPAAALRMTASLLWHNHKTARRRQHIERRADVERRARQRL